MLSPTCLQLYSVQPLHVSKTCDFCVVPFFYPSCLFPQSPLCSCFMDPVIKKKKGPKASKVKHARYYAKWVRYLSRYWQQGGSLEDVAERLERGFEEPSILAYFSQGHGHFIEDQYETEILYLRMYLWIVWFSCCLGWLFAAAPTLVVRENFTRRFSVSNKSPWAPTWRTHSHD